ncbi:hypothetical protein BB28_06630 [Mycobacteroides chelonae CCUG 47445]|nr:hypothetical protein BB28_06630 [Mycobacteroides chelonae CCUG 47445]
MRSAPAAQAFSATSVRQVSMLISRSGWALRTHSMNGTTRAISASASTVSPGPALTPPMSTTSAPSATALRTATCAASSVKVAPRS